jgi:hypothetical protein
MLEEPVLVLVQEPLAAVAVAVQDVVPLAAVVLAPSLLA